tara:strand:- start:90006 stop:90443 length:438 start_codon:yes stop_codon:yes gene_type:complete
METAETTHSSRVLSASRGFESVNGKQKKEMGLGDIMLTITPTADMDQAPELGPEVFAVIDGKKVYLPADAKYVMQDRRGLWYYSTRKPRPKEGDWTPNKTSIACRNESGFVRALKTDAAGQWLETCQRTIRMMPNKAGERRPLDD